MSHLPDNGYLKDKVLRRVCTDNFSAPGRPGSEIQLVRVTREPMYLIGIWQDHHFKNFQDEQSFVVAGMQAIHEPYIILYYYVILYYILYYTDTILYYTILYYTILYIIYYIIYYILFIIYFTLYIIYYILYIIYYIILYFIIFIFILYYIILYLYYIILYLYYIYIIVSTCAYVVVWVGGLEVWELMSL